MDEPRTCGAGLAQRSVLPARLSALTAAMAEILETHQQTLDFTDDNAKAERIAYEQLTNDYRRLTSDLRATADQLVKYVADSTQGFTLMLAGLKALLEHGVRLNLVGDRYPKGVDEHKVTKD